MRVSVTEHDIKVGRRHEPDTCPVARAIRRSFTARPVIVWTPEVLIGASKYILPADVSSAILNHDRRVEKMQPMEFELDKKAQLTEEDKIVLGRHRVTS